MVLALKVYNLFKIIFLFENNKLKQVAFLTVGLLKFYLEFLKGPILFNIILNTFFFVEKTNICNFADGSTLNTSGKNEQVVFGKIMQDSNRIIDWFKVHSLSANPKNVQEIRNKLFISIFIMLSTCLSFWI